MVAQYVTANAYGGGTRFEDYGGKPHLVAPVVLLTPGVHSGSNGPLYYPPDELARAPEAWNMRPVLVYHPAGGTAATADVVAARGVGHLRAARWAGGKLRAEAWIDTDRLEDLAPEVGWALLSGKAVEVSTGLYTDNEPGPGVWGTEAYEYVARNYQPDHLAILPEGTGACSVADGCGLLQTNEEERAMHEHEHEDDVLPMPTMNFGNQHGCDGDDTHGLPLPTMNFGNPCDCDGGDSGPVAAPACRGAPLCRAPAANAAAGVWRGLPLPSTA